MIRPNDKVEMADGSRGLAVQVTAGMVTVATAPGRYYVVPGDSLKVTSPAKGYRLPAWVREDPEGPYA